MRTSVNLPDETAERFKARADEAGISQSEWLRRVIDAACIPDAYPATTSADLETLTAERDQAREDLATAGARLDVLTARIAEVEAESDRAREETAAARLEAVTVAAARDREHDRAVSAETLAAARAAELERVREDLAAERERARADVIQAAALAVRAALPAVAAAPMPTDQAPAETIRLGILDGIRAWLRRRGPPPPVLTRTLLFCRLF